MHKSRRPPTPASSSSHPYKRDDLTIGISESYPPNNANARSRQPYNGSIARSTAGYYQFNTEPRSPSSPASAYFVNLGSPEGVPQPTPDARDHFAYSSTLRRHPHYHHETDISELTSGSPQEIWSRMIRIAKRLWNKAPENVGYEEVNRPPDIDQFRDTPSAKFATCDAQQTLMHFRTSLTAGLSNSIVLEHIATYGYNEFTVATPEPVLLKFAKTIYESPLILLLCGSAVISAVMGNTDDAISITVAVLIVLTVGFVQEQRSEKSLEALNKLVPHHTHVIRDSVTSHILANNLVIGDIVTLSTGDRVPADIRILEAAELEIDESSLTGETLPRIKTDVACVGMEVPLADRSCIGFMGTLVRNGRGKGVVIATGKQTEFGIIFSMMQDVEEKRTPLQLSMDELAHKLSLISFGVIGIICIIGVLQDRSWLDMFTIGVSLAVAAIPEGLPIVTTVTLALGVLRMAKRKAIVKKLHSVEALGSVSVICSDKTGTLTKNEQTVTEIYAVDEGLQLETAPIVSSPAIKKTLEIGSICNNASMTRNEAGDFVGQATDVALLNVLDVFSMPDPRATFTRTAERPFNSEQKFMSVTGSSSHDGREMYYIKGSIDAILDRCKFYYVSDTSTPALDASTRNIIATKAHTAATRGLRVLAMAYSYNHGHGLSSSAPSTRAASPTDHDRNNLIFVGFQAMLDPPRKGVADAITLLQSGGVQVVMITGDAEQTALSIAKTLGMRVGGGELACLTGKAIDQMSKQQLKERVGTVSVFARTTPRHKMAIVEAFRSRGAVVAMTGDGVNDAPALKLADIGISMGKSGTDVAKEAADVILVDDNFSTILPAVEEGKTIFHNIQGFLAFQLSTAAAALSLITLSTLFGLSNPLNAMQILFINILMDGPPSQSLGVDPVDPAVMKKPPRRKGEAIITRRLLQRIAFSASLIVFGTLFIYQFALADDHMSKREQTMTFTCFVFLDLISAIQNRGLGCGIMQNKMLILTVSTSFFAQLALVYIPLMQSVFQTEALQAQDLMALLALAGTSFGLHEMRRRYERALNADMATAVEELA